MLRKWFSTKREKIKYLSEAFYICSCRRSLVWRSWVLTVGRFLPQTEPAPTQPRRVVRHRATPGRAAFGRSRRGLRVRVQRLQLRRASSQSQYQVEDGAALNLIVRCRLLVVPGNKDGDGWAGRRKKTGHKRREKQETKPTFASRCRSTSAAAEGCLLSLPPSL